MAFVIAASVAVFYAFERPGKERVRRALAGALPFKAPA
jgi:hypothetical protein